MIRTRHNENVDQLGSVCFRVEYASTIDTAAQVLAPLTLGGAVAMVWVDDTQTTIWAELLYTPGDSVGITWTCAEGLNLIANTWITGDLHVSGAFTAQFGDFDFLSVLGQQVWDMGNLVPGAGGGFDADLLDGQHGAYYRDAGNLNAGTLLIARSWAYTGGNVTSSAGSAVLTIGAAQVTLAMQADLAALSVMGRSANSSGAVAAISGTALTRGVLAENGASALAFSADYVCVLDRIITTTTIVNTGALTTIYTKAVSHDDINGHALRLTIGGTYLNDTGVDQTIAMRAALGADYYRDTSLAIGTSTELRAWSMNMLLTSRSTTTQTVTAQLALSDAVPPVVGVGSISSVQLINTPIQFDCTETTSGAGTKTVAVKFSHSAASASLSISLTSAILERL